MVFGIAAYEDILFIGRYDNFIDERFLKIHDRLLRPEIEKADAVLIVDLKKSISTREIDILDINDAGMAGRDLIQYMTFQVGDIDQLRFAIIISDPLRVEGKAHRQRGARIRQGDEFPLL